MTAKTAAERMQSTRDKRAREGLAEVRGIWAPKSLHRAIKAAADKLKGKM